jgi:hypothetical protein
MTKRETYREELKSLTDWDEFLLENSGLPGPRGNIELAQAVADEGSLVLFNRYIEFDSQHAPVNSSEEFLAFCGTLGLGRLVAEGRSELLVELKRLASDPRWRTREAVAMALQRLGDVDMSALVAEMTMWSAGNRLEQRAAAAALCEPKLLVNERYAKATLDLLDEITASIVAADDRMTDEYRALRKSLGYCWSVAAAALPSEGFRRMQQWFDSIDPNVRWVMKQNLKKARLERIDANWVAKAAEILDDGKQ